MKITEKELRQLIRENLLERYKKNPKEVIKLAESTDFVARREIQASVDKLVLDIEKDIILKALDVVDPNKLDPKLQAAYLRISDEMRTGIKLAIQNAVKKLAPFPRNSDASASKAAMSGGSAPAGIVNQ